MDISLLLSPEVQKIIEGSLNEDTARLTLKLSKDKSLPVKEIIAQVQGKQKAKNKLPRWYNTLGIIYPAAISMEQSSSEAAAKYKSSLIKEGKTLIDLTGGFGVDAYYFSKRFEQVVIVERNKELVETVKHNFQQLGVTNAEFVWAEAKEYLTTVSRKADCIYLDPARRDSANRKVTFIEDYEPDAVKLLPELLQKAQRVMIKTSPMLDIDAAIAKLKKVERVAVLAVENECKEVLYVLSDGAAEEPLITACNISAADQETLAFLRSEERNATAGYSLPLAYLYEPNAAVLKAGAFKTAAVQYGLYKLHEHSHLYTSEEIKENFPGRIFKIKATLPFDKNKILKYLPDKKANVAARNFKSSVAEIRKKTGIKEGGESYIFATTSLHEKPVMIVAEKVKFK